MSELQKLGRLLVAKQLTENTKPLKKAQEQIDATLQRFRPPFSQSGNWVNDSKGTSVCEMTPDVAKLIAAALNEYVETRKKAKM